MKKAIILFTACLILYCAGRSERDRFIKLYFPDGYAVTTELAVKDEERARGLMFRDEIHEDHGMLFLFEEEDIHSFWMKNMRFPIDILWLDRDKRIVHIEARVPPCPGEPCPTYAPAAAAAFVLELQSGFAEKHGLRIYDRLEFILPKGLNESRSQRS
jgi:uncharacterized membrane protein (UPF0127 family)